MTQPPTDQGALISDEDRSKDDFFVKIAHVAETMVAAHGKEFAMGTLILAARFIAEGKPLSKPNTATPGDWIAEATQPPQ